MNNRKHHYHTRKDCPNFHPVTPEDPDGWCGCGVTDLEYELKYAKIALTSMEVRLAGQKSRIEHLNKLLASAT